MAHISARLLRDFEQGKRTRRQLIQSLAFTATAASVACAGAALDARVANANDAPPADANDKVGATLKEPVRDTPEVGLQVAAYLNNKLVVDAWAGRADEVSGKKVDADTLFMLSSTTKGVTSTCMHILVEKHKLDYDMPIVKVWSEFGTNEACGGPDAKTLFIGHARTGRGN